MITLPTLKLVRECKIRDLLPRGQATRRWEASGVLAKDQHFFVVFDDRTEIARVSNDLQTNSSNGLFGVACTDLGCEGITYNATRQRFYLLVESRKQKLGEYKAEILEYDDEFRYLKSRPIDFIFKSGNKGFKAVVHVQRFGRDYVLALCEGNKCKSGAKGRKPGGGRVQLFEKKEKCWAQRDTIELPECAPFVDYSAMAVDNGRVAVVSQVNSMLWISRFCEADWTWRDAGQLCGFPRTDTCSICYSNVEGVGWIGPERIVTVSDKRKKKKQPDKTLSEKDQSIHIFDLPT